MSTAPVLWRALRTVHDPANVLAEVAMAVALGGDCAGDVAVVRAQPQVFGAVASDAAVSPLIAPGADDVDAVLAAIRAARAAASWRRK